MGIIAQSFAGDSVLMGDLFLKVSLLDIYPVGLDSVLTICFNRTSTLLSASLITLLASQILLLEAPPHLSWHSLVEVLQATPREV